MSIIQQANLSALGKFRYGSPVDYDASNSILTNETLIENQYKKNSLIDTAHNTSYLPQPYVTSGIQRKGNETPEGGGIFSFDDGFIRGGAVRAADSIAKDLIRIGKFFASPRGILFTAREAGLALTNPNVETTPFSTLFGVAQTKIMASPAMLASVAGAGVGIRFSRYGVPFANTLATYTSVQNYKRSVDSFALSTRAYTNRLVSLTSELGVNDPLSPRIPVGVPIPSQTGFGGANSVYGIGVTTKTRYEDTSAWRDTLLLSGVPITEILRVNPYTKFDTYSNQPILSIIQRGSSPLRPLIVGGTTEPERVSIPSTSNLTSLHSSLTIDRVKPGYPSSPINQYATIAYNSLPTTTDKRSYFDFRERLEGEPSTLKALGVSPVSGYYKENNLQAKYGWGDHGAVGVDRSEPNKFLHVGTEYAGNGRGPLITDSKFRGDKITAIDIHDVNDKVHGPYPYDVQDFVWFFFEDADQGKNMMPFRCTITGLSDNFSPSWDRISILGRPDGAYLYSAFEREISFSFKVAATSRSEMIPMWRKLNYLASYTMPDYNGNRPSGPFMRISIGHMFRRTPGFITSLGYSIPEDTSWDIAEDYLNNEFYGNPSGGKPDYTEPKKLPMMVEVSCGFKIVGDYRPEMKGRVYSLSPNGEGRVTEGQWLRDSTNVNKQ